MSFSLEVRDYLVLGGIPTAKITIGSSFKMPAEGEFLSLIVTGGLAPQYVHNSRGTPAYVQPGMQLLARSKNAVDAEALIHQAYDIICPVRDTLLGTTLYLFIKPVQEPFDMGLDANTRSCWAFNIRTLKRPS